MEPKKSDIRVELEGMMADIQRKIGSLKIEGERVNEQLRDANSALAALRTVYEIESKRLGEHKTTMFPRKGPPYRFAGMRLVDAIAIIRQENPKVDKRQALRILEGEGFDFRGKRPLSAVHFAWIAFERRKK